jgi:hypothetical protein
MILEEFFEGREESRAIFEAVRAAAEALGPVELRVSKSQIALAHTRPFAWVWVPEMHLRRPAAPLVLTFSHRYRKPSARWKEIYEAKPGRFTHHLELWSATEVDDEVREWLREARDEATSRLVRPA